MSTQSNQEITSKQNSLSTQSQHSQNLNIQKLRQNVKTRLTRSNVLISTSKTPVVREPIKPLSAFTITKEPDVPSEEPKEPKEQKVTPVLPNPLIQIKVPTYFVDSDVSDSESEEGSEYDENNIVLSDISDPDSSDESDEILDEFKSNPYEESRRGGVYYPIVTPTKSPKVIDVIDYPKNNCDKDNYYLYNNGTIRINYSATPIKIKGVEKLDQLFVLGKYLGGLFNGRLYFATTTPDISQPLLCVKANQIATFEKSDLDKLRHYIIRVNSVLNREYLSVQTKQSLILFNNKGKEIERVSTYPQTSKRVYGINKDVFIDIDIIKHTATLSTDKSVLDGILDAAINYNGSVAPLTVIRAREDNLIQIKYVQGSPYYISE